MSYQEKLNKACNDVRAAWGLRTSTFEQISGLIAAVAHAGIQEGVDQKRADVAFGAIWNEWTRWRALPFMLAKREQVSATITRWPNGRHYYVTLMGDGVNISEKFNTQPEAQKFLDEQVRRLIAEGREVLQ